MRNTFRGSRYCVAILLAVLLIVRITVESRKSTRQRAQEVLLNVSPLAHTADILSSGFLLIFKRQKGFPLPPRVDLVFVLDSSNVVGQQQFHLAQAFTNRLIDEFSVSPSTTRVALVLCSTLPKLHIDLGEFVNREGTRNAVGNARFMGGAQCNIGPSLQRAHRLVIRSHRDTRKRAHPVVFIITASLGYNGTQSAVSAKKLQEAGAEVFLLAVGSHVTRRGQPLIVSSLVKTHHLLVRSFEDLSKLADYVKEKGYHLTCSGNKPVYDECMRRCTCSAGKLVKCYRVRKEFSSMSVKERSLYIQALKAVSTLQPYKELYDHITRYHPQLFSKVHKLKYFFPWHRWYILKFENFLRRVDCRITVPYWDWSWAVSDNRLWRTSYYHDIWHPGPHGLGGNGVGENRCVKNGPFRKGFWSLSSWVKSRTKDRCLTRVFNDCFGHYLPNRKDIERLLSMPRSQFTDFEENVREFMHNDFHNAVGGVMSLDESASAPEFWFHHGFLDKLWSDWQSRGAEFKYQFYDTVKSRLPGAGKHGTEFVDLTRQPLSVNVAYDQPNDEAFLNDISDPRIPKSVPVYICDEELDDATNYRNRIRNGKLDDDTDDDDDNDDDGDENDYDDNSDDNNDYDTVGDTINDDNRVIDSTIHKE